MLAAKPPWRPGAPGGAVCRLGGGQLARVYLDSVTVDYTIHRNENLAWQ